MAEDQSPAARRDVNAVLRDHDEDAPDQGRGRCLRRLGERWRTPCLHVMLARDSSEARQAIPAQIEGYKVVVEITGEIRPLPSQSATASPR